MTQLEAARKGIVTEEMRYVAGDEGISPELQTYRYREKLENQSEHQFGHVFGSGGL